MASSSNNDSDWIWSHEHQRYYRVVTNKYGHTESVWGPDAQPQPRARVDSGSSYDVNMAPAAPNDVRTSIVFQGTPEEGWYEKFDERYRVRTRAEEHHFFVRGRVFAMLWHEPAAERLPPRNATENSQVTEQMYTIPEPGRKEPSIISGRWGQGIYSQIRRFVVVRVNKSQHFVEACAITTYGRRGVLKPGCNPSEHTIVYLEGTQPQYFEGELQKGMTKAPIAIRPTDPNEKMDPASRLRLGKIYSIECNVKVRDIGVVSAGVDRTRLLLYHSEEKNNGFEPDEDDDYTQTPRPTYSTVAYTPYHDHHNPPYTYAPQ